MKFEIIALVTLIAVGDADRAWAYCSEPTAPSCVNGYGKFDDQYDFDNCKRNVENFKSEIESFVDCKRREINEANDEAEQAAEEARSKAIEAQDVARKTTNEVESLSSNYSQAVNDFNTRAGN
ncbi:hypothetical protein [Rhizobium leguminosarum]|uniref:hypothetical protein n=1 Tax=Rhizobium leguminosarum TaxID=384 RepID=UPI001FEFDAB1|nr:hypothetical protein [Rhizobium leguminosarum]